MESKQSTPSFPYYGKPLFVGEFGTDHVNNTVKIGRSLLRYLYEPCLQQANISWDLKEGYSIWRQKPKECEQLDNMLRYIIATSEPNACLQKIVHDAQIVCWRGILTRVAAAPYETVESSNGFCIAAVRYKGVIFVAGFETALELKKAEKETAFSKEQTYGGFKFEQFCSIDEPNTKPNTSGPVSTCESYSAVFKCCLGERHKENHVSMFVGAETDAVDKDGNFVEMKTQFRKLGHGRFWKTKELKWWLQSFLVGIERIIVGIKQDESIVREVRALPTVDLARYRAPRTWEPAVCIHYLHNFLLRIRSELSDEADGVIVLAELYPQQECTFRKVHDKEERAKYDFMLPEFLSHFSISTPG